MEQIAIMKL